MDKYRLYVLYGALFISVVLLLIFGSQQLILSSYLTLETNSNQKFLQSVIQSIETKHRFILGSAADNSEWDDTYSFVNGEYPEYPQDNFRDVEGTLGDLDIEWMIFTDSTGKILLNLSLKDVTYMKDLEQQIIQKSFIKKNYSTFLRIGSEVLLYHRHLITNSDASTEPNGYLYIGTTLDEKYLKEHSPSATSFSIGNKELSLVQTSIKGIGDYRFNISTHYEDTTIENALQIINGSSIYVATIFTNTPRSIYLEGQRSIFIFMVIIIVSILLIFFLLFQRHRSIENEKDRLSNLVDEKTSMLNLTMLDLRSALSQLEQIAYVDELTGIHTRRSFFEKVEPLLQIAHSENIDHTIALIDLDDFKLINDTYGHDVGDKVLKNFCQLCTALLDGDAIFARLGGEEFVICFPRTPIEKAVVICEHIRKCVNESIFRIGENTHINYTISIGIEDNSTYSEADKILREADKQLYSAKREGKNTLRQRMIN